MEIYVGFCFLGEGFCKCSLRHIAPRCLQIPLSLEVGLQSVVKKKLFSLKAKSGKKALPHAKGSQGKRERCSSIFWLLWQGKDLKCHKMARLGQNWTFPCKPGAGSTLKVLYSQERTAVHLDHTEPEGQYGGSLPSTIILEFWGTPTAEAFIKFLGPTQRDFGNFLWKTSEI